MKTKKQNKNHNIYCDQFKRLILKIFLLVRYYVDILIDFAFGYYYKLKKQNLPSSTNPLLLESATAIGKKIKNKEIKSEEVVSMFINRIKEVNSIINALVDNRFDEALDEARKIDCDIENNTITEADFAHKPFLGVPFTTKESAAVKGLSFTCGLIKRRGKKASFDADFVAVMKKAGGICLGVTNMPQLNFWQETSNPIFGTTNNPYDTTCNVGGSSGGDASLLATGGIPLSIGSDIGGSDRIPAFMCGIFGHKPTSHLVPTKGMTFCTGEEEETMLVMGPMTRYAEDLLPFLDCLIEDRDKAAKLKLYVPVDVRSLNIHYILNPKDITVSPFRAGMKETLDSAVTHFASICTKIPLKVEFEELKNTGKLWKYWMSQESAFDFLFDITDREFKANPMVEIMKHITVGSDYSLSTIYNFINCLMPNPKKEWAEAHTDKLRKEILDLLGDNGVLLYPSAPWPASYHYTSYLRPWNFNLFSIWNVLKLPVTQVPMGLKNGLPVGIQVVAGPYQDRLCFAVAKELESAFGGFVPPYK